ncbi:hypothetical protein SK128_024608 [Halocaridina rubra]|uniref:Uncharacterized protein n=1 Tax=Halocaridina rubra TaxID=373956 RepID=A0AAN8XA86_HALRR
MAANWALLPLLFIHSFLYGVYGYNISITASPFPSTLDFGEEIVPEATISIPAGYVAEEIGIEAFIYNTTRFVVFVWPGSLDTQGLTVANGTNLTRNTSEVMEEVYDGLYHSLGSVTNPGATDVDIKMNFSLAVVNKVNTSSVISGRIGTGAYISNTGIYVTSTELSSTLQISSSLPTYTGGITCSPSSVEIDYFTLCNATFTSSSRYSSPVIITVYVGNSGALQPNTVSIGNIQEMERSGKHLMIPADFRRNITYNAVSDGYNTSVSLSIGHVVKPDGDGTLVVEFIMAAKNDDSYVGQSILMKAGITCDGVLGGTVSGSVPTVAKTLTQQQLEESMVDVQLLDTAIRPGSIFRYNITIDLKGKTDKYKMYFDAEPSDPAVAICAMSPIYHEWNTPHILPKVTDQTYVLGYSIYNTLQNVDPDYAKVQYIVASKFHGAIDDSGSIVFKLENGAALPSLGSVTIQNLTSPIPSFTASTTEVSWNTLEPNRAVAMRVRLSLEKDTDFNNFRFFGITINNTASEFPIMVCNSFLADVNENLPCLQPQIGSLENNTQYFRSMTPPENVNFSSFPDSLDITFESINSLSAADGEMLFEIHLTFPWGVPEIEVPSNDINTTDRPLLYHFGVQVGEALIWTDFVNLTFGNHMYRQSHQLGSHPITGPDLYLKYKHAQGDTYENAPLQLEAVIQL